MAAAEYHVRLRLRWWVKPLLWAAVAGMGVIGRAMNYAVAHGVIVDGGAR